MIRPVGDVGTDPRDGIVYCHRCGAEIGRIIVIDGIELMRIGGLAVRNVDAVCLQCGATNNWRYPDRLLQKIIDNRLKRRDEGKL